MSSREQLIKARLGLLSMAAEIQNVAKACRFAGVSRSQFYAMLKSYKTHGREGLAPQPRRKPQMPNRTPASLESRILLKTHTNPIVSYVRLAELMRAEGIAVTATMVRYVWQRHGLSTRSMRVHWVKKRNGKPISMESVNAPHPFEFPDNKTPHLIAPVSPTTTATAAISTEPLAPKEERAQ
jgi:hypothetical protein